MAEYAEDNEAPVPPELSLAWLVERWGVEAVFEGQLPARVLKRMTISSNVHAAFMSYGAGKSRLADWARSYPSYADIVTKVRIMREQNA